MNTARARSRSTLVSLGLVGGVVVGALACGTDGESEGASVQDAETEAAIRRIEGGLLPPIQVSGEAGWSLAERMETWNVEAVSVAVIRDFEGAGPGRGSPPSTGREAQRHEPARTQSRSPTTLSWT